MSLREDIAVNVVDTLEKYDNANRNFRTVHRAPISIEDMARTSFPLAVITSADETRDDITMGGSAIRRQGIITYWVDVHVWGEKADTRINNLVESVEDALDADRTRNGLAKDTEIVSVQLLDPTSAKPYTAVRVLVEVDYDYIRGTS